MSVGAGYRVGRGRTSGPRAGDAYDAGYEMGRTVVEHLRGEASRDAL